jgi:glycosyltransferase involved in cell wall biosynthesis
MKYDLIIVAASRDRSLIQMTQRAIDSCLADGADVNVILVETHQQARYHGVNHLIMYREAFNYNRCLNRGLQYAKGDVQILCNNDITFEPGWSEMGDIMAENDILSACPISNQPQHRLMKKKYEAYFGYDISMFFTGWCIFQHRSIWEKIGKLDESYQFWYSDDVHAQQLIKAGIGHWLICAVKVNHFTSVTLSKTDRNLRRRYTHATKKEIHRHH